MEERDLTRDRLVEIVREIMAAHGTEMENERLVDILEASVPHPRALDLIFHPDLENLTDDLTAEEVVDIALSYTPFAPIPLEAESDAHRKNVAQRE